MAHFEKVFFEHGIGRKIYFVTDKGYYVGMDLELYQSLPLGAQCLADKITTDCTFGQKPYNFDDITSEFAEHDGSILGHEIILNF